MREKVKFEQIKGTVNTIEGLIEIIVLTVIYYVIWKSWYYTGWDRAGAVFHPFLGRGRIVLMLLYFVITFVMLRLCDGLQFGHLKLMDVVISQWVAEIITNLFTYLQLSLIANVMIPFHPILMLLLVDAGVELLLCVIFQAIYRTQYVPKDMVMIYGTEAAVALKRKMDERRDKYQISTLVEAERGQKEILSEIDRHDAVVINDIPTQLRNDIVKYCYERSIPIYIVPKISDIILRDAPNVSLVDTPLLLVRGDGLSLEEQFLKRFFDIVLCLVAMVVAAPIMLVIAISIKLDDHGPVFYRQRRVTRGGREFEILKFRSMIVDAEKAGDVIPAEDEDPRITRVGKGLRASRLDELPQILNILKGDMSIVGPRPERVEHVAKYTANIPEFTTRLKVKGGLTGYAQIYGKYNTSAYDKLRLDLMYIENYSLLLDLRIILMTIRILFKKESTEGFDKRKDAA